MLHYLFILNFNIKAEEIYFLLGQKNKGTCHMKLKTFTNFHIKISKVKHV